MLYADTGTWLSVARTQDITCFLYLVRPQNCKCGRRLHSLGCTYCALLSFLLCRSRPCLIAPVPYVKFVFVPSSPVHCLACSSVCLCSCFRLRLIQCMCHCQIVLNVLVYIYCCVDHCVPVKELMNSAIRSGKECMVCCICFAGLRVTTTVHVP